MKTIIQHESFVNLYNKDINIFKELFYEIKSLKELNKNIISTSKRFKDFSYKDADKLKGDLFEIFGECFFKILSADNRIGVYGYEPDKSIDDFGVDGNGLGMDTKPCVVQIKFRSNPKLELTQEDLNQFAYQAIVKYNVDKDTRTNMIVFTNCEGLHWVTENKVFLNRIRTIGRNEISQLVDNNNVFWNNLNDMIQETIIIKYK